MFPRMFWLLLTKQGILLGKLHLNKSPAVILTNEPWKSEVVCVLMFAQPCICVCGFTPVYFYSSTGTCIISMTHRWLVYMWFLLFYRSSWPVIPWLTQIRKWIISQVLRTSFYSQKSSGKHCWKSGYIPADWLNAESSLKWHWLYSNQHKSPYIKKGFARPQMNHNINPCMPRCQVLCKELCITLVLWTMWDVKAFIER